MSLEKGDKVYYIPFKGAIDQYENGIVKSICEDKNYAFVVYHWDGESSNYEDYTGARTSIKDLTKGWIYLKK
jgi:hypothetical protein